MKPLVTSSLAALAGALLAAGCAVAPVGGPYYGYAYGYDRPHYYDYGGPVYYDTWPGYYYGPPAVVGTFRFSDRDRHWGGSSWRHDSLTANSDQTRSRAFRATRSPTARTVTRAHVNRHPMRGESDKS